MPAAKRVAPEAHPPHLEHQRQHLEAIADGLLDVGNELLDELGVPNETSTPLLTAWSHVRSALNVVEAEMEARNREKASEGAQIALRGSQRAEQSSSDQPQ